MQLFRIRYSVSKTRERLMAAGSAEEAEAKWRAWEQEDGEVTVLGVEPLDLRQLAGGNTA